MKVPNKVLSTVIALIHVYEGKNVAPPSKEDVEFVRAWAQAGQDKRIAAKAEQAAQAQADR